MIVTKEVVVAKEMVVDEEDNVEEEEVKVQVSRVTTPILVISESGKKFTAIVVPTSIAAVLGSSRGFRRSRGSDEITHRK
jgi:hypothetical protein